MKNENVSDQCPPNLANRRQRIIKNNTQYFLNISTVRYKSVYTRIVEIRLKKHKNILSVVRENICS